MSKQKLKRKNISILISNYFTISGGAEKQINIIAEKLSILGYEVTIITRSKKKNIDGLIKINNLNVFSIYIGKSKLSKYIYIFKSLRILLNLPYQEAIIASQYGSNSIIAAIYSTFHKTNVIVRGSGREIEIINKSIIKKIFFRVLSKKIDYIVAINKRLDTTIKNVLKDKCTNKIKHISNSINIGRIVDINKNESIVCISRIEYVKGIDILLEV